MAKGRNAWSRLMADKSPQPRGDIDALGCKLWQGIMAAEAGLVAAMAAGDGDEVRRWIHCLSQIGGQYVKLLIAHDVEAKQDEILAILRDGHFTGNGAIPH